MHIITIRCNEENVPTAQQILDDLKPFFEKQLRTIIGTEILTYGLVQDMPDFLVIMNLEENGHMHMETFGGYAEQIVSGVVKNRKELHQTSHYQWNVVHGVNIDIT